MIPLYILYIGGDSFFRFKMSTNKKKIRSAFRYKVFIRDKYKCILCGFQSSEEFALEELDAHHITDRNELLAGGYVKENGITLCKVCHIKAEEFHSTGKSAPGFYPDDLYKLVGSSKEYALKASKKMQEQT